VRKLTLQNDFIEAALGWLVKVTTPQPTLLDLIALQELWARLIDYWNTLSGEASRRLIGRRSIRVLDFDIIYPALWIAKLHRSSPQLEHRLGFPMTSSFVFRNTRIPFTLPPGAGLELARHLISLEETHDSTRSRLQQLVDNIHRKSGGESIQLAADSLPPEYEPEVQRLIDTGVRLRRLQDILSHPQYNRWDRLVQPQQTGEEELKGIQQLFDALRPKLTINNLADALTIAGVQRLLRADRADEELSVYPLLMSGTHVMLEFPRLAATHAGVPPSTLLDDSMPVVSSQYLAFATAVECFTEGDDDRILSLADPRLEELNSLNASWRKFWRHCAREFPHLDKRRARSISWGELNDIPYFRDVCTRYVRWSATFHDEIGTTFLAVARADQQLSDNYDAATRGLLRKFERQPIEVMESLSVDSLAAFAVSSTTYVPLSSGKPTGELLRSSDALRGAGILQEKEVLLDGPRDGLRRVPFMAHTSEPLFVWESTFESTGLDQLCYWRYGVSVQDMIPALRDFILSVTTGRNTSWEVFSEEKYVAWDMDICDEPAALLSQMFKKCPAPDYIRVGCERCAIMFDLAPEGDSANLELAILGPLTEVADELAALHDKTAVISVSRALVATLLREYSDGTKQNMGALKEYPDGTRRNA
jgi:hypothetical protein